MATRNVISPKDPTSYEKDLISPTQWKRLYKTMPDKCKRVVNYCSKNVVKDGSYGIGRNEELGWFVLVTQGQGPCFDWIEKTPKELTIIKKHSVSRKTRIPEIVNDEPECIKIARTMLGDGDKYLPSGLYDDLIDIEDLVVKTGGHVASRQIVAAVIVNYRRRKQDR